MNEKTRRLIKTCGPGILFASTAIGVSHLIQSTRAGAEFGLALIGFVILANLLKYPFFEYSSRYSNVTGTSVIDGYLTLGKKALMLYFGITILSMFFVTAAVGFVTAGFFANLFQINGLGIWTTMILFVVCVGILSIGKYRALDGIIKIIGIVLVVSTVLAVLLALLRGPSSSLDVVPEIWDQGSIFFLIALMGWMPMPVDISSWHGIWTLERIKQTRFHPTLRETLFEFNIGYIITSIMAIFFVILGAYVFFGTGEELPNSNSLFAHKVVTIYTDTIGGWSYLIIASSAFSVMFGTIIAVFDGYSRTMSRTVELLFKKEFGVVTSKKIYLIIIGVLAAGSFLVIAIFEQRLKELVDFATIISFLIAPLIAIFNFRLVTGKNVDRTHHPPLWLKVLSYAGIVFLITFAAIFALTRF